MPWISGGDCGELVVNFYDVTNGASLASYTIDMYSGAAGVDSLQGSFAVLGTIAAEIRLECSSKNFLSTGFAIRLGSQGGINLWKS